MAGDQESVLVRLLSYVFRPRGPFAPAGRYEVDFRQVSDAPDGTAMLSGVAYGVDGEPLGTYVFRTDSATKYLTAGREVDGAGGLDSLDFDHNWWVGVLVGENGLILELESKPQS